MIGELIIEGESVFTEWFSRGADNAYFFCEVVTNTDADVDVDVYHKNVEDSGDGGTAKESFTTLTGVTIGEKESLGLKELVRFKVTVTNNNPGGGNLARARVRFLSPIWFNKGPAP